MKYINLYHCSKIRGLCLKYLKISGSYSSWCAILAGGEYYTEWGLIVPLNELVNQQEDRQKRREKRKKKSK